MPTFARVVPQFKTGPVAFRFNGVDLAGFYPFTRDHGRADPNGVFRVVDGLLVVSGREFGGLTTVAEYSDYVLDVEWKWGGKTWPPRASNARDSGLLVHGVGPDGAAGGNWLESLECQIIEGGCGDLLMVAGRGKPTLTCTAKPGPRNQLDFDPAVAPVTRDAGRYNWWGRDPSWSDTLGFRGARDVENPAGEWNKIRVVCRGDTVINVVNGYVVNLGTGSSHRKGKIQIQSEGAEVVFKTFEVRPIVP